MVKKRNILHMTPLVGPASFGIGQIVLNLAASQQALGHKINIWCFDSPREARHLEASHALKDQTICSFPILGPDRLGYSPVMEREIIEKSFAFDVVHQHGIWTGVSRVINQWRAKTRCPTIIATHGSLEPWALRRSHWKKRLALMLYERQNLHDVSCMQALSIREAADFRTFGLRGSIAIITNGISKTWISQRHDSGSFRARHALSNDLRIMLFLGRITPKKGLPMLLHAMHNHRDKLRGWKLIIAGVNEFNHEREVQALVRELTLQPYIQFIGPQFDQDKRDVFAAADLFVLPSHSEGAPVALLEAFGAGVPVLTTKASPWEELLSHNCGWWTDISVEAIADALQDALQRPWTVLCEMGQRGKKLVSERYTWSKIAGQTLTLYDWLLNGGDQPAFVIRK